MAKIDVNAIVAKAQALYGKDKRSAEMLTTGAQLKRPTKAEEFIVLPKEHPWCTLTGLLGLPFDYLVQVAGAYDSGKSTIAGQFMAAAQKQGFYVILLDTEKKFDKVRFEKQFGGAAKDLLIVQSTMIRKGVGAILKFIATIKTADPGAKILVVHDSVGGSVSKARAEHEFDAEKSNQPASEAVENSDYMKAVIAHFDKYPGSIAWLLINQMTDKIGFGQKGQSRSGGHKISFHSSLIVELKNIKVITKKINKVTTKVGIISRARVNKNHLAASENSVYEMNVQVDAAGWGATDFSFEKEEGAEAAS